MSPFDRSAALCIAATLVTGAVLASSPAPAKTVELTSECPDGAAVCVVDRKARAAIAAASPPEARGLDRGAPRPGTRG